MQANNPPSLLLFVSEFLIFRFHNFLSLVLLFVFAVLSWDVFLGAQRTWPASADLESCVQIGRLSALITKDPVRDDFDFGLHFFRVHFMEGLWGEDFDFCSNFLICRTALISAFNVPSVLLFWTCWNREWQFIAFPCFWIWFANILLTLFCVDVDEHSWPGTLCLSCLELRSGWSNKKSSLEGFRSI